MEDLEQGSVTRSDNREVHSEAVAALLLFNCPDVKTVTMGRGDERLWSPTDGKLNPWWGMSFRWPVVETTFTTTPAPYSNLTSLELQCAKTSMPSLVRFFNMATLEKLSICSVYGPAAAAASFFKERTSNIHTLHLIRDQIDTPSLAMLIRCCKSLHTFTLEDSDCVLHSATELHQILQVHRHTLRNLILTGLRRHQIAPAGWSDFHAMESIHMEAPSIYDGDGPYSDWPQLYRLLPYNVQHVVVSRIFTDVMTSAFSNRDGVIAHLGDKETMLQLQSFQLWSVGTHVDTRGYLRELAKERGISFCVRFFWS
jgi:hypothetical protein